MRDTAKGLVLLVGAAAILYGLQRTTPGYGEITSPVRVVGEMGKRVDTSAFSIDVTKVQFARTMTSKGIGRAGTFTTSGVWVLVEGVAEARSESLTLMSADWLGPNGVRYALTQRLSTVPGMLPSQRLEPGLPVPVLMVFEVPEGQVMGGTLLVARSPWAPLEEQVRIEMKNVGSGGIHHSALLTRGDAAPWTLSVE
jgi:hypothetical protein